MGAELLILCLVRGKFLNDGHLVRCGLFYYCGCKELYNFLFKNGVVYMKGAYCYVRKGQIYSFVDPIRKVVCFVANGRKFIGNMAMLNSDVKQIYNYQINTLKLLHQALIYKRVPPQWQRSSQWLHPYDYFIENNVAWIYREGNCLGSFIVCTDNARVLEFFLETQMKLIERFINPKKSKK